MTRDEHSSTLRSRATRFLSLSAGCLMLAATGCEIEPCDRGQKLDKVLGACVPDTNATGGTQAMAGTAGQGATPGQGGSDAGAGATGEGGSDAGGEGGTSGGECSPSSQFGDVCTSDAECFCPTNYCAFPPGQTMGACTRSGCIEDPSVCPEGFTCLDLSMFDPTLPSVCVPPM